MTDQPKPVAPEVDLCKPCPLELESPESFVERVADDVGCEPDELASVIDMLRARDVLAVDYILDCVIERGLQIMTDAIGKPDSLDRIRSCFTVAIREERAVLKARMGSSSAE